MEQKQGQKQTPFIVVPSLPREFSLDTLVEGGSPQVLNAWGGIAHFPRRKRFLGQLSSAAQLRFKLVPDQDELTEQTQGGVWTCRLRRGSDAIEVTWKGGEERFAAPESIEFGAQEGYQDWCLVADLLVVRWLRIEPGGKRSLRTLASAHVLIGLAGWPRVQQYGGAVGAPFQEGLVLMSAAPGAQRPRSYDVIGGREGCEVLLAYVPGPQDKLPERWRVAQPQEP